MKKIISFWVIFLFCCSGIAGAYASDVHYDRLLNKATFKTLDQPSVDRIQQNLAVIYQDDLNWIRDVDLSKYPLTDGLIGPVTLFWVQRFLFDFKIEPIDNFIHELNVRLARMASFASIFPEEMKVLLNADFAHWNDTKPSDKRHAYYQIRRSGSDQQLLELVDLYLRTKASVFPPLHVSGDELTTYLYQLTAEDFKILQSKKEILLLLAALENKHFDNFPELKEAVEGVLFDYPEQTKKLLPVIQQYFTDTGITIDKDVVARLSKRMEGDPLFTSLNSTLSTLLEKTLSDVAYPDANLFERSVLSKIAAGIGACRVEGADNKYIRGLKLSDDEFKVLSGELLLASKETLPELWRDLKEIKALRKDTCNKDDLDFIKAFNDIIYINFVQPAIAPLFKKRPPFKQLPVQWDGDGCGCLLDDLSGMVYGFYPFWLADETEQKVNFSVLSRVAYYGLSFDEEGEIKQTNAASNDAAEINNLQNDFVQAARQHNSKVDWVIHNDKPYWDIWKELPIEKRTRRLNNLTDNIVSFLTGSLTDIFSQTRRILTLGIVSLPTRGDGVTLYFNDYPDDVDDVESKALFNGFVQGLRAKLDATGDEYAVNIMVRQAVLDEGEGVFGYTNLLEQISDKEVSELGKDVGYILKSKVLVLIDEPTSQSKRDLKTAVHDSPKFDDEEERKLLLRNIIPVIEFDGRDWDQLKEDFTYFEDNFGGVGFWPLVVNKSIDEEEEAKEEGNTVDILLERHFQSSQVGEPDKFYDRLVCEHRWYLYMAFVPLFILALILVGRYLVSCTYREQVKKYKKRYVFGLGLPLIIIIFSLAMFDPYFEAKTEEYGAIVAVAIFAILYFLWDRDKRKRASKKPTRPRLLAMKRRVK